MDTIRRRNPHTEAHRSLVAKYEADGYQRRHFIERLATIVVGHSCHSGCRCPPCDECADEPESDEKCASCWWREVKHRLRDSFPCVPDAWRIDAEEQHVYCVEVDVTNHTSDAKLSRYLDLMCALDEHDAWALTVIVVDRFGVERRIGVDGLDFPLEAA